MKEQNYFEKDGKFEIWSKKRLKIGTTAKLKDMKFKVLDCRYLPKQKCYAILCLWLKKIAMLTPTFNYYSGVDRLAEDRAKEASRIGHDVTVFAFEAQIKQ